MKTQDVKLQRRSHTASVNLPRKMIAEIPDDVQYFEAKQYEPSKKIMLTPIHPGDDEK